MSRTVVSSRAPARSLNARLEVAHTVAIQRRDHDSLADPAFEVEPLGEPELGPDEVGRAAITIPENTAELETTALKRLDPVAGFIVLISYARKISVCGKGYVAFQTAIPNRSAQPGRRIARTIDPNISRWVIGCLQLK